MHLDQNGIPPLSARVLHRLEHVRQQLAAWRPTHCGHVLLTLPFATPLACLAHYGDDHEPALRCFWCMSEHRKLEHTDGERLLCDLCDAEAESIAADRYHPPGQTVLRDAAAWTYPTPVEIWSAVCTIHEAVLEGERQGITDGRIARDAEMN